MISRYYQPFDLKCVLSGEMFLWLAITANLVFLGVSQRFPQVAMLCETCRRFLLNVANKENLVETEA